MKLSKTAYIITLGVLLLGILKLSCDNNLQVLDEETGLYSIYGNLDMDEQTNYIRIRDLNTPFTKQATETIDAKVTLENIDTGAGEILQSERGEYQDMYLHNFVVNGDIEPDTEYRVTVQRSDGASVSESFLTPTKPTSFVTPQNQKCHIPIKISIEPLNGGTVVFRFGTTPNKNGSWTQDFIFGPDHYGNSTSINPEFTPLYLAQRATQSTSFSCEVLFENEALYVWLEHYAPGFYEKATDELDLPDDILGNTWLLGAYYEEIFAIPVNTSADKY
ncbi:hypothetical protein [Gracilimonas sp. BCB1]|uniref:hypothetical protein n=1 Tax=Gracilimonas sp. BCB1 TaxID=3152362 RepID=UPI0032D901E4